MIPGGQRHGIASILESWNHLKSLGVASEGAI